MTEEDWTHDIKSAKRYFNSGDHFKWDKSSSEPDLSNPNPLIDRWSTRYFHEYVSIDDLKFYRRKNCTDLHTRSSICLYNKDEPSIAFSSLKSEYTRRFKNHSLLLLRPHLLRKRTTLKLEGQIYNETEHKSKYLPYAEEQIVKCHQLPAKNPEHLKLCGEFEFLPEYKRSFIEHSLTERSKKASLPPKETIKSESSILNTKNDNNNKLQSINIVLDNNTNNIKNNNDKKNQITIIETYINDNENKKHKLNSEIFHSKFESEMNYVPEYRSKFIQFPIEKSQSIPQLSNIKFNGTFYGISEYRENFKFYDCYSKSAPIKKDDHISFSDNTNNYVTVPEYKEKYKEPDKTALLKTVSLKHNDNLIPSKCNFTNTIPEYYESYKDPKIKDKPERGKCKESYLHLKGKIEFNPEYRSTYLDYPRSKPIIKKSSTSTIKLSTQSSLSSPLLLDTPKRKFKLINSNSKLQNKHYQNQININENISNIHRPPDQQQEQLSFTCQPEYRKAKLEYLIKERPLTRKITENYDNDANKKISGKNSNNGSINNIMNKNKNSKKIFNKKFDNDINTTTQTTKRKFSTIKQINYNNSPRININTRNNISNSNNINNNNNNDNDNKNLKTDIISPQLRLNVDNIHDFEKKFHKLSPKFGRRASSIRTTINNNHNGARDKTKIIECNPKYLSKDFKNHQITKYDNKHKGDKANEESYIMDISNNNSNSSSNNNHNNQPIKSKPISSSSFIVLEEPCKKSAWMKKSWYET